MLALAHYRAMMVFDFENQCSLIEQETASHRLAGDK